MSASATTKELNELLSAAVEYQAPPAEERTSFLRAVSNEIEALEEELLTICMEETGLGRDRLAGEKARTVNQFRMFADLVQEGSWVDARIDTAQPERKPLPKPDVRRVLQPLGPIGVFAASNFPLAFSVAGGDTASALAGGCPVVVKIHPGHPRTGKMMGDAIKRAVKETDVHPGVFGLLSDQSIETGIALVQHPAVKAIGFTGSLAGGKALMSAASRRAEPIPVFAEMGSLNPVFVLPNALAKRADKIAQGLADSVALGCGQFCTKPGFIAGVAGPKLDSVTRQLGELLSKKETGRMLTEGISGRFKKLIEERRGFVLAEGGAILLGTDLASFKQTPALHEEIFGPASLLVKCQTESELLELARHLEGQLTATLHADEEDLPLAGRLAELLREKVGRVIWNGYPTGVEVCPSMHHGGPYPATSDARFTSVGTAAIQRFVRPICYQSFPQMLLPPELRNENVRNIWRTVNGKLTKEKVT
ncbi:MAG: aldehyde dehydrogenase (NADP(+)) [Verrucomicrobia bacterium]|nr:aldehyde dehydrogenase (NADP(+)) [Verrucomicrobiota bacterium]